MDKSTVARPSAVETPPRSAATRLGLACLLAVGAVGVCAAAAPAGVTDEQTLAER